MFRSRLSWLHKSFIVVKNEQNTNYLRYPLAFFLSSEIYFSLYKACIPLSNLLYFDYEKVRYHGYIFKTDP